MNRILINSFYKFVPLSDFRQLQGSILSACLNQKVKGTILLSEEGINGTLAGFPRAVASVLSFLQTDLRFRDLVGKESFADFVPFYRMKVRLKKEIVAFGVRGTDPTKNVGQYVAPKDWNAFLKDPSVTVIDTRNHFEVDVGTFPGSTDPMTGCFREFPSFVQDRLMPHKEKRMALFCTGGIRCEKATSHLIERGFRHVYHLQGGILNYLKSIPRKDSLWEGECFVFDNRITVDHNLEQGSFLQCFCCKHPISEKETQSSTYEEGVSCPYCHARTSPEKKSAALERHAQMKIAKEKNIRHLGQTVKDGDRFNHAGPSLSSPLLAAPSLYQPISRLGKPS